MAKRIPEYFMSGFSLVYAISMTVWTIYWFLEIDIVFVKAIMAIMILPMVVLATMALHTTKKDWKWHQTKKFSA